MMLGRLVFVANSKVIVLWKQAHFNIKQIKWVCVGGPLFCFTKVQLYKYDMKWGHMTAALHMKQNSRRTERIKGSFWSGRLCVVSPWTECDTQLEPAVLSNTPQRKLTTNISSAVENLPLLPINGFSIIVLFSVVDFFPMLAFWKVLEMRAAVVITAGVSQVYQEFGMLYHRRQVWRRRRASS